MAKVKKKMKSSVATPRTMIVILRKIKKTHIKFRRDKNKNHRIKTITMQQAAKELKNKAKPQGDGPKRSMKNLKKGCNFLVETGSESKIILEQEQELKFVRMHRNFTIASRRSKQGIKVFLINHVNS